MKQPVAGLCIFSNIPYGALERVECVFKVIVEKICCFFFGKREKTYYIKKLKYMLKLFSAVGVSPRMVLSKSNTQYNR